MLEAILYRYPRQEADEMRSVSCTFPAEPNSGNDKTIGRKYTSYPPDTQIEVYSAVSSGGYNIVGCKADKGTAVSEPLHQVAVYFFSDFFVFIHIVDFYGLSSEPMFGLLLLWLRSFDGLFPVVVFPHLWCLRTDRLFLFFFIGNRMLRGGLYLGSCLFLPNFSLLHFELVGDTAVLHRVAILKGFG
jgi:hypothetical protein